MLWLFRFFSYWPLAVLHAFGAGLGWLMWWLNPSYRRHFRANVAQAGLPFALARPAIAEAGRFVAELPKLWLRSRAESCLGHVQVGGQAHVEQAFARGKGVIFFAPHCGSFELGTQALAEIFGPLTAMYRPARIDWLARLERLARDRPKLSVVPASLSGVRLMHKALRANQAVAMLTDQVPPEGLGLWAPYFGRPAYTMTLAARLALQSGAALLPVSCERLPYGRGYHLKVWPALVDEVDGNGGESATARADLLKQVTRINQSIETIVRSQPGQYLWGYARYKTPRKASL
ncbi:acyltransferase [Polaromonas sp.]|nr:acyltransferase [Polaromonas sp.]